MPYKLIKNDRYEVIFEEPVLYVDNETRKRSGHMSHAMASYGENGLICFNSNNSAIRLSGHFPYGWVEYRTSNDFGETYSDIKNLEYSVNSFLDGVYTISVEKAVGCNNGNIVAFCLRNSALEVSFCEPWDTPTVIISDDGGETWSEAKECIPYKGRIYDVLYHKGVIYVYIFCNEHFLGTAEEHKYRLYKSFDNGLTFKECSVIPFNTLNRAYGSILFDENETLHAYTYIQSDENVIDHAISKDYGETWEILDQCKVLKGVRNPQTAFLDGVYIMHGRTADWESFVFYTSLDATNWDNGTIIASTCRVGQYYSNNINLKDERGNYLLVQYSESYDATKVNVKHIKLRVNKI